MSYQWTVSECDTMNVIAADTDLLTHMTSETCRDASGDDEQFVVVKRRRKKNGRLPRVSYGKSGKIATTICYPMDQVSMERIEMVMKNACSNTELIKYSQQIIALLLKSLSGRQLSSIWALGLGSFSCSHYLGCDQLAVLLELKHYFGCEVYFQEPCLTKMEKVRYFFFPALISQTWMHWLCNHAICLSETKDLLECRVSGNNLHSMDLTARYSELSPNECTVRECNLKDLKNSDLNELEALLLYSKVCTVLEFPIFKSNFAVFNDTAVHFLLQNSQVPKISEAKPKYRLFRHEIMI
ncbi:hypothetical protein X798_01305 [Onchocerca flexuosa]|uniref:SRR1-like domain-containing protein n=1 Tax=Onchocerca flexuosa TaxID=387005 RepID=A0A238C3G5_9BILA|nr:hypothetical protein X798_01305 [Onchocerca flexuosa]